ncbi:hypothetical protein [Ferruginibacter sp.]
MNQLFISITFLFTVFCSCGQHNAGNPGNVNLTKPVGTDTPKKTFRLDTNIIAILPADKVRSYIFHGNKPMELTNNDLAAIEHLLTDRIKKHNARQDTTKEFSEFIDLKKYKRQYVPYIDSNGERKVYINCFCIDDFGFNYWKTQLVEVDDGGSCFFQVVINLTRQKDEWFTINGYG